MSVMFELLDTYDLNAIIRIVGIGQHSLGVVNRMLDAEGAKIGSVFVDSSNQILDAYRGNRPVPLGLDIRLGQNAGYYRERALEDRDRIASSVAYSDLVIIVTSMGSSIADEVAPVIAQICKDLGKLTIGVVSLPFPPDETESFERAEEGLKDLSRICDTVIAIPGFAVIAPLTPSATLVDSHQEIESRLLMVVQTITELITRPGLICIDLNDIRNVLAYGGLACVGMGRSVGKSRVTKAVEDALAGPFLSKSSLADARGVLVNVTAGVNCFISEFDAVFDMVSSMAQENSIIVGGTVLRPEMDKEMQVTLITT